MRSAVQWKPDRLCDAQPECTAARRHLRVGGLPSRAGGGSEEGSRFAWSSFRGSDHTAEADVAGGRVNGMRMARGGAIAPAIVWRAKVGAALENLLRNLAGIHRVCARCGTRRLAAA